jgi:hypothetical protein
LFFFIKGAKEFESPERDTIQKPAEMIKAMGISGNNFLKSEQKNEKKEQQTQKRRQWPI